MQLVCCSLGMGSRCRLIAAGAAYLLSIDIVAFSGQHHVEIRGTRLNTNLFVFCVVASRLILWPVFRYWGHTDRCSVGQLGTHHQKTLGVEPSTDYARALHLLTYRPLKDWNRPSAGPKTTRLKIVESDLQPTNIGHCLFSCLAGEPMTAVGGGSLWRQPLSWPGHTRDGDDCCWWLVLVFCRYLFSTGFAAIFRMNLHIDLLFTARCYASTVLAMALCPPVCPSVRLSITSRSSIKTAKRRICLLYTSPSPRD